MQKLQAFDLVLFGGTGALVMRQLLPAEELGATVDTFEYVPHSICDA